MIPVAFASQRADVSFQHIPMQFCEEWVAKLCRNLEMCETECFDGHEAHS